MVFVFIEKSPLSLTHYHYCYLETEKIRSKSKCYCLALGGQGCLTLISSLIILDNEPDINYAIAIKSLNDFHHNIITEH